MKDDWNLLTPGQQKKINDLKGRDWKNIRVEIQPFDKRANSQGKQAYQTILVKWNQDGRELQTTISSQVNAFHLIKSQGITRAILRSLLENNFPSNIDCKVSDEIVDLLVKNKLIILKSDHA